MDSTHDGDAGHDTTAGDGGPIAFTPLHRRSAPARVVAVTVAVAMAVGGLVLATRAGGSGDPATTLEAAKSAFTDDETYRFSFHTTEELSAGEGDAPGVDTVTRTVTEGEVEAPNRWRISTDDGAGWVEESIRLDATHYRRSLDELDEAHDPRWVATDAAVLDELDTEDLAYELEWIDAADADDTDDDLADADRAWRAAMRSSARLEIVATGHALDSAVDPARLTRLVREAEDAEMVRHDGDGTTLRATVGAPEALADAIDDPLPDAEVEIDLDGDDRPLAVRVEMAENGATLRVDLRFSDWGAPIVVEAPGADEIDHTPAVDEEAAKAADPRLLVAPAFVPAGLTLQSLEVTPGAGGCDIATLEYWPMTAAELSQQELDEALSTGPYLWVNTHLESCGDTLGIGIDEPFDAELGGLPARRDWGWEVRVGDTVVALDTNLDEAGLARVAGSLATVDADALIAAVATGDD